MVDIAAASYGGIVVAQEKRPADIAVCRPFWLGRNGGIRTRDPLHPMQVRYQAALRSVFLVGTAGFELATPCTPCKCATRLRYAPKEREYIR